MASVLDQVKKLSLRLAKLDPKVGAISNAYNAITAPSKSTYLRQQYNQLPQRVEPLRKSYNIVTQGLKQASNYRQAVPLNQRVQSAFQDVRQNPVKYSLYGQMASSPIKPIRYGGKAIEGTLEGLSANLIDVPAPVSTNNADRLAYVGGNVLGMFNPSSAINLTGRIVSKAPMISQLQKPLGSAAGKLIAKGGASKLAGKAVANLSQGIPFTLGYAGLKQATSPVTGQKYSKGDLAGDIGVDLAMGAVGAFPIFAGLSKMSKDSRIREVLKNEFDIKDVLYSVENYNKLAPNIQIRAWQKIDDVSKKVIPEVVNSKEMKRLARVSPDEWLKTTTRFLEDALVQAKNPSMDIGLSTRALGGPKPPTDIPAPMGRITAQKTPDGKYLLKWVGTNNPAEVKQLDGTFKPITERFNSAKEARDYFQAMWIKAQQPNTPKVSPKPPTDPTEALKVEVKQSSGGNIYIKTGNNQVITGLPKTVQGDIYKLSNGEVLPPDRMMKTTEFLRKKGLDLVRNEDTFKYELKPLNQAKGVAPTKTTLPAKPQTQTPTMATLKGSQPTAKSQSLQPVDQEVQQADAIVKQSLDGIVGSSGGNGSAPKSTITDKYVGNINTNRIELSQEERQTLKTTIENIKPQLEEVRGAPLTEKEVREAAKKSEILQTITTREQTKQANAAMLKARERMAELDRDITRVAQSGDTAAVKEKMADFVDSLRVVSAEATDRGRQLQSLATKVEDESLRQSMLKEIAKVSDDTQRIVDEASKVDWDNADDVTSFYRKFITPSLRETLDEFRYNNMLSNPRTHLRNAYSNLFNAVITRPLTIGVTGDVKGAGKYYSGLVKSFPDAIKAFTDSLDGKNLVKKPDMARISTRKLPKFMTIPSNLMEASDQFFQTLIRSGEIARGTSEQKAADIAAYSLFRQGLKPEGQGKVLNAIDGLTQGVYDLGNKFPPLRWFVPFVQTPMNVAKQWIEYSPAGLTTLVGASNKKEQLAKALIGSTVTAIGASLAAQGRTTWSAPTDKEEKDMFYASGKKPYSIKIGDRWVSMQYFGPFAYAIGLPAAYNYYNQETNTALSDDQLAKIGKTVTGMTKLLAGQTFLEGLGNFVNLISGDTDYSLGKNLGYSAGQLIPLNGLVRYITTVVDPVYRKSSNALEQIQSGIPGLSNKLPAYTTPEGEPSKRERVNLVTPFDITKANLKYDQKQSARASVRQQAKLKSTIDNLVMETSFDDLKKKYPREAGYYAAEKMLSELDKIDKRDVEARRAKLEEFNALGYNNETVINNMKTIQRLEAAGLAKSDREMVLFPPEARAKRILDRLDGIKTVKRKNELLALYQRYGIIDEETKQILVKLKE